MIHWDSGLPDPPEPGWFKGPAIATGGQLNSYDKVVISHSCLPVCVGSIQPVEEEVAGQNLLLVRTLSGKGYRTGKGHLGGGRRCPFIICL